VTSATARSLERESRTERYEEEFDIRLDAQRGPVEVLVIDSAELPQPD
jgi:hypothetical protein